MKAAEWARELSPAARAWPGLLRLMTPEEGAQWCRELPTPDRLCLVAFERRAALEALVAGSDAPDEATARAGRLEVLAHAFATDGEEATLLLQLAVDVRAGPRFLEDRRRAYATGA